jgi:integrase/recombinase XerC
MDELAADADILGEAGILALTAHTLRHTLATNLLRAGVDIVVVAELLGHARLDTTRRYTLPTHTDLEDAVGHLPTDQ